MSALIRKSRVTTNTAIAITAMRICPMTPQLCPFGGFTAVGAVLPMTSLGSLGGEGGCGVGVSYNTGRDHQARAFDQRFIAGEPVDLGQFTPERRIAPKVRDDARQRVACLHGVEALIGAAVVRIERVVALVGVGDQGHRARPVHVSPGPASGGAVADLSPMS